jgi:hypothetical protein
MRKLTDLRKKEGAERGHCQQNLGLKNTAFVTVCQVRNKDCELSGLQSAGGANRKKRAQKCNFVIRPRHDTESAVLIEVLAAGLDWSCFKVACLKLWARSDLGAVFNEVALLFVEIQCFRNAYRGSTLTQKSQQPHP